MAIATCIVAPSQGKKKKLDEISGVARVGDHLLMVSDGRPGAYFRLRLDSNGPVIAIPPRVERIKIGGFLARDLEAIGVLPDGSVVVLSEQLRSLITAKRLIVEYGKPVAEFGNRGLEGLAILQPKQKGAAAKIAVLSEGGYPDRDDIPAGVSSAVAGRAMDPVILIHDLPARAKGTLHVDLKPSADPAANTTAEVIHLSPPKPPGEEPLAQRFCAPALVWDEGAARDPNAAGFIVLLTSEDGVPGGKLELRHTWLQRFSRRGVPVGEPYKLEQKAPKHLRDLNWEGLAWFEPGKSLVLVHDLKAKKGRSFAFVVNLAKDWPARTNR